MAGAEKSSRGGPDRGGLSADSVGETLVQESSWGAHDSRTPEQAEDDRQQAAAGAVGAVAGATVGGVVGGPPGVVVGAATGTLRGIEELADKVSERLEPKESG
jgi:uncharacterized protein YcfJ